MNGTRQARLVLCFVAILPPSVSVAADWQAQVREKTAAREYDVTRQGAGAPGGMRGVWQAPNRAHGFRTYFTGARIRVVPRDDREPSWEWGLALLRYGRRGQDLPVTNAGLSPQGNRVDCDRGGIVEWYKNDPRGLTHGFNLASRPPVGSHSKANGGGEVRIDLALSGTLDPSFSGDGQAIDFKERGGGVVLRYAQLGVADSRGRKLPARLEGFAQPGVRGLRLVFEDQNAVYPVTVYALATAPAWTAESNDTGAAFGFSVATAGDVNGDGYSDVIVGAHDYDNGQLAEGRAFVYLGSASSLATSPAWTAESDQANAFFGISVATAGDVNGDGYSDVIVGAHRYDNGQTDEGRAFVYLGSVSGLATAPTWTAESNDTGGEFGISVATAGDVNGDGYSDVIVGADHYDNGQLEEGRTFVYLGSASGLAVGPAWTAESNDTGAEFGFSVATAGDVNGDGYSDVIVGAPDYDNGQLTEGLASVYLGSASGLATSPAWTAESNQANALFGISVATAGDVNGDGYSDVIVGAHQYDNGQTDEGGAFVYLGSASGLAVSPAWIAESNDAGAHFGVSVAAAGDVNGDGYSDVIVGAHRYDNGQTDEGGAFVYLGSASGLATSEDWTTESDQANALFGISVATAGDVNGDGYSDVIVGADHYDNGQTDEGRAFVYLGSAAPLPPTIVTQPLSQTSYVGCCAILNVGASGEGLSYRWRKGGTDLFDGGNVSGASTTTLSLSPVSLADAGSFSVAVSNSLGSVTSADATLTVAALPTCHLATCDPQIGCALVSAVNGTTCDDGDACTIGDACDTGACDSGPQLVCNDQNVCTDDSCSPAIGVCVFTPNAVRCNDGNACTMNDACEIGFCHGTVVCTQSASFKLDGPSLNAGGLPEAGAGAVSPSHAITFAAIADSVPRVAMSSAAFQLFGGTGAAYSPTGTVTGAAFSNKTALHWDAEPGAVAYNLYRGSISSGYAPNYGICQPPPTGTTATDPSFPAAGDGFFYLVTAINPLLQEGTKGRRSSGQERQGSTCP